ncbi:MAG: thiol:disulfide interchange protein, partial [Rickettsia endosymbiont of Ixodes persulcatus]|nr:thiol:disulfide interchange protein [Rickettsia endosymbiont of Ixodes persulcatus]
MNISLIEIILSSFLGGIILNCMPCVFPILSIKIVSILKKINHVDPIRIRMEGILYTLGVSFSMLVITSALIALRYMGYKSGWGFQMQSPFVIYIFMCVTFLLGLSLSGFFNIPYIVPDFTVGNINKKDGLIGSFATGALATFIATPCSAPFMATAVGAALNMSNLYMIVIFQVLGFGIAFPYLLLSFIPNLIRYLPKPGVWMQNLKEFFAFPMYLTS